jgi:hypothetical protein
VVSHDTIVSAEAAAAVDPAPVHSSVVKVVMIDSHWAAEVLSSAARFAHDVAAAMSGPEPAPEYMSAEVTSGGIAPKSITIFVSVPFLCGGAFVEYL